MTLSKNAFSLAKSSFGELVVGLAFGKLSKLLPVKRVIETELVIAFWHPKPFWQEHIVIVPKKAIKSISMISKLDEPYIADVFITAAVIVQTLKWPDYSITVNGGSLQKVKQIHFHLHRGPILKI